MEAALEGVIMFKIISPRLVTEDVSMMVLILKCLAWLIADFSFLKSSARLGLTWFWLTPRSVGGKRSTGRALTSTTRSFSIFGVLER